MGCCAKDLAREQEAESFTAVQEMAPRPKGQTFTLEVEWVLKQGNDATNLGVKQLTFHTQDYKFDQEGDDNIGHYQIRGSFTPSGDVTIDISYKENRHNKRFNGRLQENLITGTWEGHPSSGIRGSYELRLLASVYTTEESMICLKSLQELVGLICVKGVWNLFTGQSLQPNQIELQIHSLEGSEQTLLLAPTAEGESLYGTAKLLHGEELVYFVRTGIQSRIYG